ncbi:DNA gyrase subunit A [Petroclostridium sp. X23]|uniref:DNA gyrase subunit A n=1 Tax=Petroclostridium sp. X23 TaxID=3045146 RepID=UPI0024ADCE4B|nr:DNA gyrase subunit A [Petroclostridium sp. X23]WHH57242.1 DNA gyrase subunit A [Petroclostridium sp. X23]
MIDNSAQKIIPVDIQAEMKKSYIDYAMSVIVGRALPDVRDGLKPVHRRILYTMYEAGFTPDKPHRKCATTVGDVLGKYHPHGDAAVYDSLVRMAQDFSLRYPLIDGHGNFGSVDGDPAAAYRYTEARMSKLAMEMLTDIEKETVDFVPNYDDRLKEPSVLPSKFPNLLVNGSSGIAVGMATNIPPHNLTEVINGVVALIDDPNMTIEDLLAYIKGPDFPTAGIIMGRQGIKDAYMTGRGRVIVRSKADIEQVSSNKQRIIVTEIPYQVNKARLIEKIAELVRDKRIEGISDLRDESDRDGMRIVIELKRDANANVVLNQLYKYTQMQDTFSINMLALVDNEPKVLNLREILDHYINFQKQVIVRRTKYDLNKAEARAHILEGLRIALDHIDEIINIIRGSRTTAMAKERLMEEFSLSDVQSQAILDMRLARLTGLERDKIEEEYKQLLETIKYLKDILASESMVLGIIKEELLVIKEKFGDERRSAITIAEDEINIEDLIEEEDNVITLTHFGYIKRLPVHTYKSQRRGGKGIIGLSTREEDFVETLFVTSTHHHILFFTDKGKMYRLKTYEIPEAGRQAKGTAIVNLLEVQPDEKVTAVIPVKEFKEGQYLLMTTRNGVIKKTDLMEYDTARKSGLAAITLREDDELIRVKLTDGNQQVILGTRHGQSIRFNESDVRPMGRTAQGVKAIELNEEDYVVGMSLIRENADLLVVTENGFGKRTDLEEYRMQSRGGKGIFTYRLTEKTGCVAGIKVVGDTDDIILITSDGTIIRLSTKDISKMGRTTQGVTLIRMEQDVKVVAIARIEEEVEEEIKEEVEEEVEEEK